ncbi:GntR family transcriptional regulator [Nonomuraea sp. NPDC004702]
MARRVDSRPQQQRVAAELRSQIMSGILTAGAQLPSMPQLADQYACATASVQKAIKLLTDEGLLRRSPGKGVFVTQRRPFVVTATAYKTPTPGGYRYELLHVREVTPPADVMKALRLADGGRAIERHRILLHADIPIEMSWSYYPFDIAAGTPLAGHGKIKGGAPKALTELGFPEREFEDRISARQPRTQEVEALDLPLEVPVIRQFRVVYSDNERPVEVSILVKGGHLCEALYRQAEAVQL